MPKTKPKKKKEIPEIKDPTVHSASDPDPIEPEVDEPKVDEPEVEFPGQNQSWDLEPGVDRDLLKLRFCLRTGIEYWKAELVGKPLMKYISKAYVAYKLGIPINTDLIFKRIDSMEIDVINDIEVFESILIPAAERWLANKKK